jgi:hypothetical protein
MRALLMCVAVLGCGAKTELTARDPAPETVCERDETCDDGRWCNGAETCRGGRCRAGAPVVCAGGGMCLAAVCDEATRDCRMADVTSDRDGDGHRAIRPGARAGAIDACGDDCDDNDPGAHPGATEVCNGRDDDCNGVIDDGATLRAEGEPVRVSDVATAPSGPGGLAWTGAHYAASHWGYSDSKGHVYFSRLTREGQLTGAPPQRQLTTMPADAFGAALAWTGSALGAVWHDRRDGNNGYEVYFNRLTPEGEKLGPDQRISFAQGFSINTAITWTGEAFVLAWQDERDRVGSGLYDLYAQRVDARGRLLGAEQRLTRDAATSENPAVESGADGRLGLAWMRRGAGERAVWFMTTDATLGRIGAEVRVSPVGHHAVNATLTWNRDRWIVAWYDDGASSPDHEVWAAALDRDGRTLVPARRLTRDPGFSRYPALLPLGNRVLVVWSDDRVDGRYALFAQVFSSALEALSPPSPITRTAGTATASVYPMLSRGPAGDVGVLFRDQRDGRIQTWFTRLQCAIPR